MNPITDDWMQAVLDWLADGETDGVPNVVQHALAAAPSGEVVDFVRLLPDRLDDLERHPERARLLLQLLASRVTREEIASRESQSADAIVDAESLLAIYERLSNSAGLAAAHALQCLAATDEISTIRSVADVIATSPPEDWRHAALALSPLWKASQPTLKAFFDELVEATIHPATLAVLLDLANFAVRNGELDQHPWSARGRELRGLLAKITERLQQLERDPHRFGDSVETVQHAIGESISLTVSLCDALGLIGRGLIGSGKISTTQIGNQLAKEELSKAMTLSHRRIQCEAAFALARLGEDSGRTRLIELAADRVARLRAVNYAEELGFADEIDPEFVAPQALAESELANWLAGPEQFGIPPSEMELIDTRTQFWPSYEEPRDCYLFRFAYNLPNAQMSNVGIAGPCTLAFGSDLANLPVDDIYAAFAGWQAEHEEIYEIPITGVNAAQREVADKLAAHLEFNGFRISQLVALTFFLSEIALLAMVVQDDRRLCAVTNGEDSLCYPVGDHPSSMTPEVVLCIYRGRKLLRTFNA